MCTKAKGHQKQLDAAVGRDAGDGVLDDFELCDVDGDVVEVDAGDDDPRDLGEDEGDAEEKACGGYMSH